MSRRPSIGRSLAVALVVTLGVGVGASGCGGALLGLAKDEDWAELDRQARAQKRSPRGKAARAWATALVELGKPEEARAVLLRDFRSGGQEPSLFALAELERELGRVGIAGAHHARLANIDVDTLQRAPNSIEICELFRARAKAEAKLDEPLAADLDMRRLALVCPQAITDQDREFMAGLRPQAQDQARAQRSLAPLAPKPQDVAALEARLAEQLALARKRGPRAVSELAADHDMQVEPEDVAMLLAAEFGGALGPGLASSRRLSGWIGDAKLEDVVAAIETLPEGVRQYALLRLSSVQPATVAVAGGETQNWMVAAMQSVGGQGPHEAAKAWRVAASVGDLSGAEFALNTNLRDMSPTEVSAEPGTPALGASVHWSRRVVVERRSFDLLLTLARLLEHRDQPVLALELRRAVLVAGQEIGLAQAAGAALEEVRRELVLGHPWQALAIAEVVPGPLLDEVLPAVVSAVGLARAVHMEDDEPAGGADRNIVWRALGDAWFERWDPRLDAAVTGLDLGGGDRCPALGRWLDPQFSEQLREVGLDPQRSREALDAAFDRLGDPATGAALASAIESDLALSCSAPLIHLLHAGPHLLTLETLDERLIHAPELSASTQLQLHAEIALAHGQTDRATLLTIAAAAQSGAPLELWGRAAVAGRSFGAREYTLEALRQVLLHSDGLDDPAARRELALTVLRDVDADAGVREGDVTGMNALREQLRAYVEQAPKQRRWSRIEQLLGALANETRADALAWQRLLELIELFDPAIREGHPAAVAALEQAAARAKGRSATADSPALGFELAFLSDPEALCDRAWRSLDPSPEPDPNPDPDPNQVDHLIGAATTCSPRVRAAALAALVARTKGDAKAQLRARVLAGPLAVEPDPEHPGVARSIPALGRAGASLRVAYELPLEPIWIVGTANTER
ncbi:hypothetical protein DB30_08040 [Enhygromyxa salina]|uniref:Uncharacterized protein n=1 Tax=Enhygromyxa salina TaxID=215803 RepID=A0A0C1Z758_9BACT|nr:hypothetical protein [Enhygromyxa salina]KIG13474.1 hypothetical protein DB30_08040 [Enhygromyxa salina]